MLQQFVVDGGLKEQPSILLNDDEQLVLSDDVQWLAGYLNEGIGAGLRFRAGRTLRVGFTELTFRTQADGQLVACEPDFESFPMLEVPTVTRTLRYLRLQRMVAESFGLAGRMELPPILRSCVVCTRYEEAETLELVRLEAAGRATGWFIRCASNGHDHEREGEHRVVSVYEAVLRAPLWRHTWLCPRTPA